MRPLKRTLILWAALIFLYVVFYQLFSKPSDGTPAEPVDWGSVVPQWLPFVLVVAGFFGFIWYQRRRYTPFLRAYRLGVQGEYEQALELFEAYRKAHPKDVDGAYRLGNTRLLLWKLEDARRDLEAANSLKQKPHLRALVPEHLALAHALLGNAGEARRLIAEVPAEKSDPGLRDLVLAILSARAGDWAEARTRLGTFEAKQQPGFGAFARTVDAFCIEQLTGERRHVDRLAVFGNASTEELEKHWPELAAFVERAPPW